MLLSGLHRRKLQLLRGQGGAATISQTGQSTLGRDQGLLELLGESTMELGLSPRPGSPTKPALSSLKLVVGTPHTLGAGSPGPVLHQALLRCLLLPTPLSLEQLLGWASQP